MRATLIFLSFIAILASLNFAYPAAAAASCPSCYGFRDGGGEIYLERDISAKQSLEIKAVADAARNRVRRFYGALDSNPRVIICLTEHCYERFGGNSRGLALLDKALFLSPRGIDVVIAAHEMAHIELHHRIGLAKTLFNAVPQWFDEGLAVVASDDPRYLKQDRQGDRCQELPDGDMPTTRAAWIETAQSRDLYAKAACRVNRWLDAHGGSVAVPRLANAIAKGASFETIVH